MSTHADTQAPQPDPFGRVLGQGRGLSSTPVSHAELRAAEERLVENKAKLKAEEDRRQNLEADVKALRADVATAKSRRASAEKSILDREKKLAELTLERDRARYAAMRAGNPDPCPAMPHERTHQGEWTPGRPYLSYQHAWHPTTGECYRACSGGAPAGEMPGTGGHWELCDKRRSRCPYVVSPWGNREHPVDGPALRQTELWWDKDSTRYLIRAVSEKCLQHIIAFLREHAEELWCKEAELNTPFLPSPWNAYPAATEWLGDTPLMRGLLHERRRRAATRRQTNRKKGRS